MVKRMKRVQFLGKLGAQQVSRTQAQPDVQHRPSPALLLQRAQDDPYSLAPHDLLQLQRTYGNQYVQRLLVHNVSRLARQNLGLATQGSGLVQRIATADMAAVGLNSAYLTGVGVPGLAGAMGGYTAYLNAQLLAYQAANGGVDPPAGHALDTATDGYYRFSERMIEQVDGGWTEVAEADRLRAKANPVQFPALGIPGQAPDISYQKPGGMTGIEVKAVNSADVARVNAQILAADAQLAVYPLARRKILVWIAHQHNRWPGVVGWANRNTNALLRAAINAQIAGMAINNADLITILDVNVNYAGGRKDVQIDPLNNTCRVL